MHIAIACAQILQDLAQFDDIGGGLFGATNIRTADNLHQAHARPVKIDKGHVGIHVVDRFTGVLFHMDPFDPNTARNAWLHIYDHFALANDRVIKLADLIALGQIRVEVVFPIKR